MSFSIFWSAKTPFLAIKIRSLKRREIDIFTNRLTHGFGQKMAIFHLFFLRNIGKEKVFYDTLERENVLLGHNNKKFKKLKKLTFFQKG